ncbi:MAG TPA: M48 family metallopeptidase [Terriglobales bacterium]
MKSHFLLFAATLLAASLAVAQTPNTNPANGPSGTTNSPAQTGTTFPGGATVPATPPQSGGDSASQDSGASTNSSLSQPIEEPDPSKVKHDGGKDDVDAIGNRKIGNRGFGNWYSIETDIKMGKSYAQQVEATSKMVNDPVVTEYINRLGQNLVRNSDAQVPFSFKVIDSDAINAFSLPGGFVYINTGTILAADEEAELAGVMAHEIAHVCARHATRQMTRAQIAQFGTIPLIFVGGGIGYAVYEAAGLGLPMTFLAFQRGFEAEADYLGLQYEYKAGYDPQAFISFFEKIQAQEKQKPGTIAKAFATHPQTPDRIEESQKEIATILPARPEYTVTTSEFDDVKSRLASIENRRKMTDQKDSSKPSLRRANTKSGDSGNTGSGSSSGSSPDDHPTLKRRGDDGGSTGSSVPTDSGSSGSGSSGSGSSGSGSGSGSSGSGSGSGNSGSGSGSGGSSAPTTTSSAGSGSPTNN